MPKNSRNDKCFTLTFDIHQSSNPMLMLDISRSVSGGVKKFCKINEMITSTPDEIDER